jgi:isovaleryl-CoA dehydrogenase
MTNHNDIVARVVADVIAPNAAAVDADGTFPRAAFDRLAAEGILGLISSAELGGGGLGLRAASEVVQQVAAACGSTAMVLMMHYSATAVLEQVGDDATRRAIATGRHLSTLAFSEVGSRSHFWAPQSSATAKGDEVALDAAKSWVTSAGEADSYVWSSRPLAGDAPMTLWFVPSSTPGLSIAGGFDGFGLRGNASLPMRAEAAIVPAANRLGDDGAGLDLALGHVLPTFLVCSASVSLGLMEAACADVVEHLSSTRLEHLGVTLGQTPLPRAELARIRIRTDATRALIEDCLTALETGRPDAMLRVLEVKAAAGEAAADVTDAAMKVCGGAAFRKERGIERRFRDARAARVMAPTTDALYDFVGRALLGLPLLGDAA